VLNWYAVLKYIHVLSVVVWIGGLTGLSIATWGIVKARDRAMLTALVTQTNVYVQRVAGPAAGFALLSGLAMVWLGRIGFNTFWVWFGYAGVLVQVVVGGFLVRKRALELVTLLSAPSGDDAVVAGAARRLRNIQMTYLILFAIVIAGMVIKPTP
jgi:hypothetical protein